MSEAMVVEEFAQVCVWPACVVGKDKAEEFEEFMLEKMDSRVKYIEEIETSPDRDGQGNPVEDTGGRNDVFFYIHKEDVGKFAVPRLSMGIRWIEDVLDNETGSSIYPERVEKYRTWES